MFQFLKGFALAIALGGCGLVCCGFAMDRHFDRVIKHESRNNPNAVGDQGRSHGYGQISVPYYIDARKQMAKHGIVPPPFAQAVKSEYWTKQLMRYYAERYCPKALAMGDTDTFDRIHNGGPTGCKKPQTLKYVRKVRATR
jgi:hypothetical protein